MTSYNYITNNPSPADIIDTDPWQPWLVATATGGVLPLAMVVVCVSSGVMFINSGSNKNLSSFFNVQMALSDFFMAVGPMVVFFAMVTGRIDLQTSEANLYGCLTAVVLSYTTSDISATMLVLYVVAAYYHIYYINASWYQAQISKKKLQWGSHVAFLVLCVLNMYRLDMSSSVLDLCTILLPASMFGHAIFILFMLVLAWLGVLICGCPIFFHRHLPSMRSSLLSRRSHSDSLLSKQLDLMSIASGAEFENNKFMKYPIRYRRLRLEDISEEYSAFGGLRRSGSSVPWLIGSKRCSEESLRNADSLTKVNEGSVPKSDLTERGLTRKNLTHLLDTPEGRIRADGLSQVRRGRFSSSVSRHADNVTETSENEKLPYTAPQSAIKQSSLCRTSANKSLQFPEVSDTPDTGQQQRLNSPDFPWDQQDQSGSLWSKFRKPAATFHSVPTTQINSFGDDGDQSHSVELGHLNIITEQYAVGETSGARSFSSPSQPQPGALQTDAANVTRVSDTTVDPLGSPTEDVVDSGSGFCSCTPGYVDTSSRCTQTDSHDLKVSNRLKTSGKKHRSKSGEPGKERGFKVSDLVFTMEKLPKKRSPSADSMIPGEMGQSQTDASPYRYSILARKHREKRKKKTTVLPQSELRSSGDYDLQGSQGKCLPDVRQVVTRSSSWIEDDVVQIEAIQEQRRERHAELLSKLQKHPRPASSSSLFSKERESIEKKSAGDAKSLNCLGSQEAQKDPEQPDETLSSGPDHVSRDRRDGQRRGSCLTLERRAGGNVSKDGASHCVTKLFARVYMSGQKISRRGRLVFWRLLALVCVQSMLWLPAVILALMSHTDVTQPVHVAVLLLSWLRPLVGSSMLLWFTLHEP